MEGILERGHIGTVLIAGAANYAPTQPEQLQWRAGSSIWNLVKNIVINIVKNIVINIVKNIVFLEAEALTRNLGFLEDGDLKIPGKRDGDN